jgi:hypothetical protein
MSTTPKHAAAEHPECFCQQAHYHQQLNSNSIGSSFLLTMVLSGMRRANLS